MRTLVKCTGIKSLRNALGGLATLGCLEIKSDVNIRPESNYIWIEPPFYTLVDKYDICDDDKIITYTGDSVKIC